MEIGFEDADCAGSGFCGDRGIFNIVLKIENRVLLLNDIEGAYIICNNTVTQGVKLKLFFSFT
jgi:hypothetical protein